MGAGRAASGRGGSGGERLRERLRRERERALVGKPLFSFFVSPSRLPPRAHPIPLSQMSTLMQAGCSASASTRTPVRASGRAAVTPARGGRAQASTVAGPPAPSLSSWKGTSPTPSWAKLSPRIAASPTRWRRRRRRRLRRPRRWRMRQRRRRRRQHHRWRAAVGGTRSEGGSLRALPFLSPHPLSFFIHFFSYNYIPCVLCVPHGGRVSACGRVWFDSSVIQRKSRARDFYFLHHPPSTCSLFFCCSFYHQRNARWEALSFPTQASTTCACVPVMQT